MDETHAPPQQASSLLVVEDVAALLRLTPAHVRKLLARGELPGRRRGKRWYVLRGALLAYMAPESPAQRRARREKRAQSVESRSA